MGAPGQTSRRRGFGHLRRIGAAWFTMLLYLVNAPFGYLLFGLLCFAWRRDPARRAARLQRITSRAYRLMHDWIDLVGVTRFDWRTALPELPQGACVVVANHPTLMDVTAVSAAIGGGVTIAKPAMFRRSALRPLLVSAGHVEGPGGDSGSIGRVIEEAVERLGRGLPLIVFPEGTRTVPGQPVTFGRLAFEIACRARVPVVALGIRCDPPYCTKQVSPWWPPDPTPVLALELLGIHDPLNFDGNSRRMTMELQQLYRDRLGDACLVVDASPRYGRWIARHACPTSSKTA